MKKVLFIGPTREEQELVDEAARLHPDAPDLQLQTTASFGQEAPWWVQNQMDLLVLRLPDDETQHIYFFSKLKNDIPKSLPLILVTPVVSQELLQVTPLFQQVRIVKTPVSAGFLYRCVLDVTAEREPGKRQIHPRYMTEQSILVSNLGDPQKVPALMRNLSISGAYFETQEAKRDFQVESMVKIEIHMKDSQVYEFDAKIVWVKTLEDGLTKGYGCAFIDANEIYESLMKGFGN